MGNGKSKILTIVGARPQFIKAAALDRVFAQREDIDEDILHTGQHYDDNMSASFFRELDISKPRYNLGVGSGTHGRQTAAMLEGIEKALLEESYDGVLVFGDTNSTLAGALAAAKLNVPVFHVEAGLRSFNRAMPEEINRVLTDHASNLLFAPTRTAVENLRREGFADDKIVFSGDVMLDNVLHYSAAVPASQDEGGILLTIHRNMNTDDPARLDALLSSAGKVAASSGVKVLFPAHPRTLRLMGGKKYDGIEIVPPLSYCETLSALRASRLVMTDSGGLQKEAFFCGRPCVVLRDETEWTEIVDCGAAVLASADTMASAVAKMWDIVPQEPTQFGDGHAAEHIAKSVSRWLRDNHGTGS